MPGKAQTAEAKAACKKVCEALRYSDPVSSSDLLAIEQEIQRKFYDLSAKVVAGDDVSALSDELAALIADRNRKCRALKEIPDLDMVFACEKKRLLDGTGARCGCRNL